MLDYIFLRHVERFLGRSRPDQLALNQKALGNHRTLVDAIASRKPKRAEAAWQDHMDQLRQVIIDELGPTTVLDLYRSEEHTSELQSLMRISYAVFCLKKKKKRIQ